MVYRHKGEPDTGDLHDGERTCRECRKRKPMTQFHWANGHTYRRRVCKACVDQRRRVLQQADPEKFARRHRFSAIKRKYGLSKEAFEALLVAQMYRCEICLDKLRINTTHIDHDHKTNRVRGLLCTNCNLGLGHFRDDTWRLRQAITYLHIHDSDWPAAPERPFSVSEDVA